MKWALLSVLGSTGVLIVALCIVVLFVRGRLRRLHRVDPAVATTAPTTWLVDPRAGARLHRRLAAVGRLAGKVADDHRIPKRLARRAPEQPPLVAMADDLRAAAVRLDHELGRISLLAPAARRPHVLRLGAAADDLEHAAARLEQVSAEVLAPPVLAGESDDITNLATQLARLAEAHRALTEIDEANGLVPATDRPPMVASANQAPPTAATG